MTRVKGSLSTAKSELFIFNEDLGHWFKEAWHSNSSYESFKTYRTFGTTTTTGGGWKGHGNFNNNGWDYEDDEWSGYGAASTGYTTQAERDEKQANGEATTCNLCGAVGSVNVFTSICSICVSCNDCLYDEAQCDCYNPHGAKQPANLPSVPADQVEPRQMPDRFDAEWRGRMFDEWDESDDPAVQAMTWAQYILLREYEEFHNVNLTFTSIDQMQTWLAEQEVIREMMDASSDWHAHVAHAKEDVTTADELLAEVREAMKVDEAPGFEADMDGIIRRLA
jgi:hypothetical protein